MSDHISVRKLPGKWVVFTRGAVYGETRDAVELIEGDRPPVIYIPRADIAMAFFDKTDKTTTCPHKGTASYYSIDTRSVVLDSVAWSYETPNDAVAAIAGHLAFSGDEVAVEQQ
jgi:uncharacterized protein (DUF427 family)